MGRGPRRSRRRHYTSAMPLLLLGSPRIACNMNTPFAERQDGKFSVEEYFALIESRPEEERWQLIDGVAMMMPPPTRVHQQIASNLAFELNTHFRARCRRWD